MSIAKILLDDFKLAYAELIFFVTEVEEHGMIVADLERFRTILQNMQEQVDKRLEPYQ